MRRAIQSISICVAVLLANSVSADPFGSGANEFTIDFVNISGDASSANGTNIGDSKLFNDPGDYRIGTYEITNDQWDKFVNAYGTVTGSPSNAYDVNPYFTGTDIPTNKVDIKRHINSPAHRGRATTHLTFGVRQRLLVERISTVIKTHIISFRLRMNGSRRPTGMVRVCRPMRRRRVRV